METSRSTPLDGNLTLPDCCCLPNRLVSIDYSPHMAYASRVLPTSLVISATSCYSKPAPVNQQLVGHALESFIFASKAARSTTAVCSPCDRYFYLHITSWVVAWVV